MKNIKILFVIILLGVIVTSCKKKTEVFDRDVEIEFTAPGSSVYDNLTDLGVSVQMDGPLLDYAINVTYQMSPVDAVEGTHFSMVTSGTFTIPAQSNFGYINLNTLLVPSGETREIDFTLTGGDYGIRGNSNSHTITIEGPVVALDGTTDFDTTTNVVSSAVINLVGTPRNTAQTVGFTIDPSSTAVAGVHYNMVTTGTEAVIAANGNTTEIDFDVIPESMNSTGQDVKLVFDLNNSGDLIPVDTLFTFNFVGPKASFKTTTDTIVENNSGSFTLPIILDKEFATLSSDRTVNFETSGSAIDGTQYTISSSATIPADSRDGIITINILDGLTTIHQDVTLVIKIIDTGNIGGGVAEILTITIKHPN